MKTQYSAWLVLLQKKLNYFLKKINKWNPLRSWTQFSLLLHKRDNGSSLCPRETEDRCFLIWPLCFWTKRKGDECELIMKRLASHTLGSSRYWGKEGCLFSAANRSEACPLSWWATKGRDRVEGQNSPVEVNSLLSHCQTTNSKWHGAKCFTGLTETGSETGKCTLNDAVITFF